MATACGNGQSAAIPELDSLDSLIEKRDDFKRAKLVKLSELQRRQSQPMDDDARYTLYSMLYQEYLTYNSDSAMKYVDANIDLCRRLGNTDRLNNSLIQKSYLLSAVGLLSEAESALAGLERSHLSDDQLVQYYGLKIYLYSHFGNYTGGETNQYYVMERAYRDSVMTVITPEHSDYVWYKSWDVIGTDRIDPQFLQTIVRRLEQSDLNSRQDAMDAYVLSRLYQQAGNDDQALKYMALSAMIDVRIANAEIASLADLARMMFDRGDIDRAYRYIKYSLDKAIEYPNRGRAFDIMKTLDTVSTAYQDRIRQQQRRTAMLLTVACLLTVVLALTIAIIIKQNRHLRRQGASLDSANKQLSGKIDELSQAQALLAQVNSQLKQLNADLTRKNEQLAESNYVKEEYIGYVFTMCSKYIRKLDELRKSIHAKVMAKKYREIEEATSGADMSKDELRDFYQSFDTVFLHIYPDFVSDFNSLLQEGKEIVPKEGELLNTELRIYALVRLGITDSVKIAEFLHCSPQTVYNNRFKVRNKANVDKKNFVEAVSRLGKFHR